jgi:hypothetical protein
MILKTIERMYTTKYITQTFNTTKQIKQSSPFVDPSLAPPHHK